MKPELQILDWALSFYEASALTPTPTAENMLKVPLPG